MATLTVVKPAALAATQFTLDGVETTIGRSPENKIVIDDRGVSRQHAKIVNTNRGFLLVDAGSRGGTYIRGREIKQELLHEGDLIQFGDTVMRFGSRDDSDATMMSRADDFGDKTTMDVPAPEAAPPPPPPVAQPSHPPAVPSPPRAVEKALTIRCIACALDIPLDSVFCPLCGKPQRQEVVSSGAPGTSPVGSVDARERPSIHEGLSAEAISSAYTGSIVVRRWLGTVIDFLFLAAIGFAAWKLQQFLALWLALLIGYYPLLEGYLGATFGKYIAAIRVVDQHGGRPGLWKGILRTLARLIEVNPVLFGGIPAGIIVLTSKKKQRLGDMMAGTFVLTSADARRAAASSIA